MLADAINTAANNGSGSSSLPIGISQTTGIGSVVGGSNGLAPMLDHLLDLKKEVAVDNAEFATCGFLTNAKVESVLAKSKDSLNQYLLSPYGAELGRSKIGGRRLEVSNNVPSNLTKGTAINLSAVIYGNSADMLIGMFGQLEILLEAPLVCVLCSRSTSLFVTLNPSLPCRTRSHNRDRCLLRWRCARGCRPQTPRVFLTK